jgi:Lon protease-like protein
MLDEALKSPSRLIGMVQPLQSKSDNDNELHKIGCAGRISSFSETDDGRYMITLSGVSRFKIDSFVESFSPFIKANINWENFSGDETGDSIDEDFDRDKFFNLLKKYFSVTGLKTDWESLRDADEELLINSLSMLCPFNIEEKQALLESDNLSSRRVMISTLMEFSLHGGDTGGLQ